MDINKFYVTTFCNFPHRLRDGKPIGHECYIIPPSLLRLECGTTDWDRIHDAWQEWHQLGDKRKLHRGVKDIIDREIEGTKP